MRIFALSDIHVDYDANANWVRSLSRFDYRDDLLILAGDVCHKQKLLASCVSAFAERFRKVVFAPGNHDLWVLGESKEKTSLQKFREVEATVRENGAYMEPLILDGLLVMPLLGWYDYSFGLPNDEIKELWMDFRACRWPEGFEPADVAAHFTQLNRVPAMENVTKVITFSHFLPRIDLMPSYVPGKHRLLAPVLGSAQLEEQLRQLKPAIHVYGHSHINRSIRIDGVRYVNNAFGYPHEDRIAAKQLLCIDEI